MSPAYRHASGIACLAAAIFLLFAAPVVSQDRDDDEGEVVVIDRPLESLDRSVALQISPADVDLAIGDVFTVVALVQGRELGEQITVVVRLGARTLSVPARRVAPDGSAAEPDETGPWLYETAPLEIFPGGEANDDRRLAAEFRDVAQTRGVAGITGPALVALIEDYLARAGKARHPLEAMVLLEKISALLLEADSPALYQYAARLAQAAAQRSPSAALLQASADEWLGTSESMLNIQLRERLDALAKELIDDDGRRDMDTVNIRRGLALVKETALNRGIERLIELNRWKRGSGAIAPGTFLAHDTPQMMARIRKMKNAVELERFLQTNGIANSDNQLRAARAAAAQHARRHRAELESVWARMLEAREWYNWASRQIELVFDYGPSRAKYAAQYAAADGEYNALLREYALLKTMVDDGAGNSVPLWKAIAATQSDAQVQAYFDAAVDATERAVREMLGNVVVMRTVEDLTEIGSPRYRELHAMAESSGAPAARSYVGLASGMYQQRTDNDAWKNAAVDFGLNVVQIAGALFPPAFYTATAVLVTRRGDDVIAAYGASAEAEAAEAAGVGSRLEADNARRHFRSSIGHLGVEVGFGMLEAAAIRSLRAASRAEGALTIPELQKIGNEIKQQWAAQRRFERQVADLKARLARAEDFAAKKQTIVADWDRKIKNALRGEDEALRNARMASRAEDHRKMVKHRNLATRTRRELAELIEAGPQYGRSRTYHATQGKDVERAAYLFWERLADDPAKSGVQRIGERRFQLGERIEGTVGGLPRRRFEYRFNETIVDPQGRTIKPPERVHLPGENAPVSNPAAGRTSMEFDRLVIDHKDRVIYLEDLIRTGNREHLIKTHSYTQGLEQMFPGYRVAGVAREGVGAWPRDVVWGKMSSPISAISADLRPYTVVRGESVTGR